MSDIYKERTKYIIYEDARRKEEEIKKRIRGGDKKE